jgi:glycosyltransferase involved in cell wall biosynthesis
MRPSFPDGSSSRLDCQHPRSTGVAATRAPTLDCHRPALVEQAQSVSVVIPTFNRRDSLRRVIDSVLQDPTAAEIVIVVDGSADGSIELLDQLSRSEPRVKPLVMEHRGLNAAVQAGVEEATREIVLILDDDLEAMPGLVSGHERHHRTAPNLVVLGYSPVTSAAAAPGTSNVTAALYGEAYERSCRSFESRPNEILLHLYGGHMSIRRSECLRIGVYSENFRERYHPDREFGIRCLKAGLIGRFDRALVARHHYDRSLSEFRSDTKSQGAATSVIHKLHGDVLGPVDRDSSAAGAPPAARLMIRLCRVRTIYKVMTATLPPIVRALGRLHAFSLQRRAAKLLGRMEHQRGLYDALGKVELTGVAAPRERDGTPTMPAS